MVRRAVITLVLIVASSWSPAHGHVAPSPNTNNRYLKVTPMGDRVRLAYTVYMGENPGARARTRMDRNRDGALSPAESEAYGAEVAEAVKGAIEVTVDGGVRPVSWQLVHVGLGTPITAGRSFSIDLIAWFCLPEPGRRRHTLTLTDRFRISAPGEVELRIDESPGVTVTRSRVGAGAERQLAFTWSAAPLPLSRSPLELAFTVAPDTVFEADEICGASEAPGSDGEGDAGYVGIVATVGGAALLIAIAILVARKGAI